MNNYEPNLLERVIENTQLGVEAPGVFHHPSLGRIQVYREFKPTRDTIEYTVYFRWHPNGPKQRLDFDIEADKIPNLPAPQLESYLIGYMDGILFGMNSNYTSLEEVSMELDLDERTR